MPVSIRDTWEQIPEDGIGLLIYLCLTSWYGLRQTGNTWIDGVAQLSSFYFEYGASLFNDDLSKVISGTVHVMFEIRRILGVL